MHRIDTPDSRDGRFDDNAGNPGERGSVVDDDWLNAVQEELAQAIEGLGTDPLEKGTNDQLLNAITSAIAAAKQQAKQECYPVGSIYWNYSDSRNPATVLGFGSWAAVFQGRVPVGVNYNNPAQSFVGSDTNLLTIPRDGWGAYTNNDGGSNGLQTRTESGRLITGSGNIEQSEKLESLAHAAYSRSVSVDVRQAGQTAYAWRRTA